MTTTFRKQEKMMKPDKIQQKIQEILRTVQQELDRE